MMKFGTSVQRLSAVGLLLLGMIATASAQESRGSITDANDGALSAATVTLKNVETNVENKAVTNEDGNYNFALVHPGKYSITADRSGLGLYSENE